MSNVKPRTICEQIITGQSCEEQLNQPEGTSRREETRKSYTKCLFRHQKYHGSMNKTLERKGIDLDTRHQLTSCNQQNKEYTNHYGSKPTR